MQCTADNLLWLLLWLSAFQSAGNFCGAVASLVNCKTMYDILCEVLLCVYMLFCRFKPSNKQQETYAIHLELTRLIVSLRLKLHISRKRLFATLQESVGRRALMMNLAKLGAYASAPTCGYPAARLKPELKKQVRWPIGCVWLLRYDAVVMKLRHKGCMRGVQTYCTEHSTRGASGLLLQGKQL
jgi:hypothetical protein